MTSPTFASYAAEDSQSPQAPPISPITPAAQFAVPATPNFSPDQPTSPRTVPPPRPEWQSQDQPTYTAQPPSIPLPEDDNIDAIALRAAMYTLQIQKEKSIRDIKTLQKLKTAAGQDPEGFLDEYTAGRLRQENDKWDPLGATFEDNDIDDEDDDEATEPDPNTSVYPMIPSRQNVIRCPPINWAKYEIVGAPLDRLHEAQRRRPSPGEPVRAGDLGVPVAHEHSIYAPYDPFKDRPETNQPQNFQPLHPMVTRKASSKPA